MAWSVIRKPGSKNGPCRACEHLDCAASRELVARACTLCGRPIGYGTQYTSMDEQLVHFTCALNRAVAEGSTLA